MYHKNNNDFEDESYRNHSGLNISGGFSIAFKKNLFSVGSIFTREFTFSRKTNKYNTINVLYGYQFDLSSWLILESHTGFGWNWYTRPAKVDMGTIGLSDESFNIPVKIKFMYHPSKRFALGPDFTMNFSPIGWFYTANIDFQFKLM